MIIKTSRFGMIEVEDNKVISFPAGLFGFPNEKRYLLLDHDKETPFRWLQSADNPDLAFVVIDPLTFRPDYHVNVKRDDLDEIQPQSEKDLVVLALVTIPRGNPAGMTANLQGPLVVNVDKMLGKQIILLEGDYSTSHSVIQEMRRTGEIMKAAEERAKKESQDMVLGRGQGEMGLISLQASGM